MSNCPPVCQVNFNKFLRKIVCWWWWRHICVCSAIDHMIELTNQNSSAIQLNITDKWIHAIFFWERLKNWICTSNFKKYFLLIQNIVRPSKVCEHIFHRSELDPKKREWQPPIRNCCPEENFCNFFRVLSNVARSMLMSPAIKAKLVG